jgi:ribosome-binding factor A
MKSYRPDKVASVIRAIVGEVITEKLQDPRISRFTSVTRVEVSGDLQVAKVFVSVMGTQAEQRNTMRGLDNARGVIQRAVARGVSLRVCPQLRIVADSSIKKAHEILRIIEESVPSAKPPDGPDEEALDDEALDDDGLDDDGMDEEGDDRAQPGVRG